MQQGHVGGYEPGLLRAAIRLKSRSRSLLQGGHPVRRARHQALEDRSIMRACVALTLRLPTIAEPSCRPGQLMHVSVVLNMRPAPFARVEHA
jgi:hypothetical protein